MIFSYLVFAVLGFIMISTFTARYNQKYLEKHFASALRRESNLIATSFGTNYYSSDMTLTQFQKQLYAVGSYLNADIYVVDTDRKILVTSTESWEATDSEMIPDFDILDFGSDYYNINHFYNLYDSDVLGVYTPVTHNYSVSCYVLICQPLSHISDLQYGLLNSYYLSLIFLALLAMIILVVFFFTVYRPLNTLSPMQRAILKPNWSCIGRMNLEHWQIL